MTYSIEHIGGVFRYEGIPIADQGWARKKCWLALMDKNQYRSDDPPKDWTCYEGQVFQVELSGRWEKQLQNSPGIWFLEHIMMVGTWLGATQNLTWTKNPNEAKQFQTSILAQEYDDRQTEYGNELHCYPTEHIFTREIMLFIEATSTERVEQTSESILPCPFCGGRPIWTHLAVADDHFHLKCAECNFEMKQDRQDKVIGYWNRRVLETAQSQEELWGEVWDRLTGDNRGSFLSREDHMLELKSKFTIHKK